MAFLKFTQTYRHSIALRSSVGERVGRKFLAMRASGEPLNQVFPSLVDK